MNQEGEEVKLKETVPVFGSWNGWYFLSVLLLIVQIVFFYLLTVGFNE